jgi:hypothetical protein
MCTERTRLRRRWNASCVIECTILYVMCFWHEQLRGYGLRNL